LGRVPFGEVIGLLTLEAGWKMRYKTSMKTTLGPGGQINIPEEIRRDDHLIEGDAFEVQRLTSGHYLLAKQASVGSRCVVKTAEDGLPVIQVEQGIITSALVKELESQPQ
jgi:bifunctional DNA-binding transcriptional regulator/antitoxin component of YhaV-PrlF toxin-antitoxin module